MRQYSKISLVSGGVSSSSWICTETCALTGAILAIAGALQCVPDLANANGPSIHNAAGHNIVTNAGWGLFLIYIAHCWRTHAQSPEDLSLNPSPLNHKDRK